MTNKARKIVKTTRKPTTRTRRAKAKPATPARLELRCDAIDTVPQSIHWRDALGENMDGWRAYEAMTCDTCGRAVVVSELGEVSCRDALPEIVEVIDGEECEVPNACRGTFSFEGPMMNYWYPVRLDDCEAAARAIAHLPLCVVEVYGRTGLALTGGGMDLSWEICEAFVALGYFPPLHFCDLPGMAGRGKSERDYQTIRACVEACEIAEGWTRRKRERLLEMKAQAMRSAS